MERLKLLPPGLIGRALILLLPFIGGLMLGQFPAEFHAFCGLANG